MGLGQTFYQKKKNGQKLDIPEMGLFFQGEDAYMYMYWYLLYIMYCGIILSMIFWFCFKE